MGLRTTLRRAALELFLRSVAGDIRKGKYGMALKRIWEFLDGKKTWVGLVVTFLPQFVELAGEMVKAGGGSADRLMQFAGIATVILGSIHKLLKGDEAKPREAERP